MLHVASELEVQDSESDSAAESDSELNFMIEKGSP